MKLAGVYVQEIDQIGTDIIGCKAQPVTDLLASGATTIFITAFDAAQLADHIAHLVPENAEVVTLDQVRLDDEMIGAPRRYLEPINFATNFAFSATAAAITRAL